VDLRLQQHKTTSNSHHNTHHNGSTHQSVSSSPESSLGIPNSHQNRDLFIVTGHRHCSSSLSSSTPQQRRPRQASAAARHQEDLHISSTEQSATPHQRRPQPSIADHAELLPSTNLQRHSHRSSQSSVPALLTISAVNRIPATAPAATHHPQRPHLRQQPPPSSDTGSTAPPSSDTGSPPPLPLAPLAQAGARSEPSPTAAATGHRS